MKELIQQLEAMILLAKTKKLNDFDKKTIKAAEKILLKYYDQIQSDEDSMAKLRYLNLQ